MFTFGLVSCSDESDSMDEEMEMESVDLTTQLVGTYSGDSRYQEGGSGFAEDNRNANVV